MEEVRTEANDHQELVDGYDVKWYDENMTVAMTPDKVKIIDHTVGNEEDIVYRPDFGNGKHGRYLRDPAVWKQEIDAQTAILLIDRRLEQLRSDIQSAIMGNVWTLHSEFGNIEDGRHEYESNVRQQIQSSAQNTISDIYEIVFNTKK